jgi:hypothetical protein
MDNHREDTVMPDEFPTEEPIIIPKYIIGTVTLSDGQEIIIKDIAEGDAFVDYRRIVGYTGDCTLNLTVSSEANAQSEIIAALEIELVSKTKVDPVSFDVKKAQMASMIQNLLDNTAKTRNYDGILSACTYATSSNPQFQAEGQACVLWRDAVWAMCYQIMADIENGVRTEPTVDELLAELPQIVW